MAKVNSTAISEKRKAEYKATYDRLMSRALERKYESGTHERHHIVPRSLGGSNEKHNIVCLTYREHFLAHWLLTKFTEDDELKSMKFALWSMTFVLIEKVRIVSGWQYRKAKENYVEAMKGNKRGKTNKGSKRTKSFCDNIKNKMLGNANASGKRNEEFCNSMLGNQRSKGHRHTLEHKEKISGAKNYRSRAVICLNDGNTFLTINDAAGFYGNLSNISAVCRGVKTHTKGFRFEYLDSEKGYLASTEMLRKKRLMEAA